MYKEESTGWPGSQLRLEPSLDAYAAPHRQRCASSKALLGISEESKAKRPQSVGSEARAAAAADRRLQREKQQKSKEGLSVCARSARKRRKERRREPAEDGFDRRDYNRIADGQGADNFRL